MPQCIRAVLARLLFCDVECDVDPRIRRIAQVIHAVNFDHKDVLRVKPIAWPLVNEYEGIATVLEAAVPAVISLAHAERVLPSKTRSETFFGNTSATAAITPLRLLGISLLPVVLVPLLRVLFFLLVVVPILLLRVLFFLLVVVLVLLPCVFSSTRLFLSGCCAFLFLLAGYLLGFFSS
jgi:hypothetical protein